MKAKRNRDIPFTDKSINNAIGVLLDLLKPTTQATVNTTATRPRVSEVEAQRPRVDNNNNNNDVQPPRVNTNTNNDVSPPRVLRPRAKEHQQKYSRGTRLYGIVGEPNRLVEHWGYISDLDKKEEYYT